jgi:hypothetical protein
MAPMPVPRGQFKLITYGDAMYAIGGNAEVGWTNRVDRWTMTQGWVNMANYPKANIYAHCAVADEGYDAIYVLGGIYCASGCYQTAAVYKYTVSTDTWNGFYGLLWSRTWPGCGIIRRRTNGNRLMILIGHQMDSTVVSFDLTANVGWNHYQNLDQGWARSNWISLTPFESYLAGGNTQIFGDHRE